MKRTFIALFTAARPLTALAHEVAKGPNGGPVVDSAGHHVEMVAKGTDLVLYLTEGDDRPLVSAGIKNARALVQDGGKTTAVQLSPAEPNRLLGMRPSPLGSGARVVVSVRMADGRTVQGRFVNN